DTPLFIELMDTIEGLPEYLIETFRERIGKRLANVTPNVTETSGNSVSVSVPVSVTVVPTLVRNAGRSTPEAEEVVSEIEPFPCRGKLKTWILPKAKLAEYEKTYEHLDVLDQMKRAWQWVQDRPTQRKTAKGMPQYLSNWLNRECNSGRGKSEKARPPSISGKKGGNESWE
ncbi:hypothetical protein LCGC14_3010990, partial [marine sediment metagenome]